MGKSPHVLFLLYSDISRRISFERLYELVRRTKGSCMGSLLSPHFSLRAKPASLFSILPTEDSSPVLLVPARYSSTLVSEARKRRGGEAGKILQNRVEKGGSIMPAWLTRPPKSGTLDGKTKSHMGCRLHLELSSARARPRNVVPTYGTFVPDRKPGSTCKLLRIH